MDDSTVAVSQQIISYLSHNDTLRKSEFKGSDDPLGGHCYVATEALYHYLGAEESSWTPHYVKHEGTTHWFLKHTQTEEIIDLTVTQFTTKPPYDEGTGCGFQNTPSQRCITVLKDLEIADKYT